MWHMYEKLFNKKWVYAIIEEIIIVANFYVMSKYWIKIWSMDLKFYNYI